MTDATPVRGTTAVDPAIIATPGAFSFVLQWQMPDITYAPTTDEQGRPAVVVIADDGGHATITTTPESHGRYPTHEYGSAGIVERLNAAADLWNRHHQPTSDRFGITASTDHQRVWLDHPQDGPRWPLAPPTS